MNAYIQMPASMKKYVFVRRGTKLLKGFKTFLCRSHAMVTRLQNIAAEQESSMSTNALQLSDQFSLNNGTAI